ncbi:selenocysteine synthase [Paludibaculum fermentans]|uniref:Selenocysteine synthase n=2 Tax=Paludibaculum fermentans TaxID=1473598 RepID=A0A7S7SLB1_PALFE|nr:selenocysteine synthase [Paludibaculum fermentans]
MFGRRPFLGFMSSLPFAPGLRAATKKRDVIAELGVRTFINAAGTYTALTASLMPPEVMDAMRTASRQYVNLIDLQDAVGKRIATLLECESAMVTSGAACALTIGTAACLTGKDRARIQRLPDVTGMPGEVLVQKSHRYGYDHAVRACGVKLVEIETAEELEKAAGPQSAMMLFFNDAEPRGRINADEWARLGKKLNIPTFNDASADVPPVSNLKKYTKLGFDLVTFSGGKGICGPQSAGLLLGRKDLIEAARMNTSPNSDTISRGMKVNKEEMVGMLVALEAFMQRDHEAEGREWDKRVATIQKAAEKYKTVSCSVEVPPIANHTPHLKIKWDQGAIRIAPPDVLKALREGSPSIEACPMTNKEMLVFTVWMMQPGDAEVVARRVAEILKQASA